MFESFKKSSTSQEPDSKLEGDLAYLSHQKGVKDYRAGVDKKSAESYEKDPRNYDATELSQVSEDEENEKRLNPEIKEEFERLFKNKTQMMKNFEDSPQLLDRIKLLNSEKLNAKMKDINSDKLMKVIGAVGISMSALMTYMGMDAGPDGGGAILYSIGGLSAVAGAMGYITGKFEEISRKRAAVGGAKFNLSQDIEGASSGK
ncbi:MAG: hypothetical protein Q7U36_03810 [bacterium]|nr:hypothetical protein [bacterium]